MRCCCRGLPRGHLYGCVVVVVGVERAPPATQLRPSSSPRDKFSSRKRGNSIDCRCVLLRLLLLLLRCGVIGAAALLKYVVV